MSFKVSNTKLPGVLLIEPKVFGDDRGFFYESFNLKSFQNSTGLSIKFLQDNHSKSSKGVLRGLHYQIRKPQGKLVRVISGSIFDVVVDIRLGSPTYGQWFGEKLSSENKKQLWIPPNFAHGFLVLSESAEVLYKATNYYAPNFERSIRWDDPSIAIKWPIDNIIPVLSPKDAGADNLVNAELPVFKQ